MAEPFWRQKSLDEMTPDEWESLCDGCGRCCLNKLEDWDTGEIAFTSVACALLDEGTCRCGNYENRTELVPDCVALTPTAVRSLNWLPPSCAYRLVQEGKDLAWWHPLVSGDPHTVHHAGISVLGRTISEDKVDVEEYEAFLVDWLDEEIVPDN
ncbi:MAG: YcgN family cysteine cluster protein [Pseudomonadota bacterium]